MTGRDALPSAGSSTTAKCKTVMIISVSSQELFNAISPPHADPGRLERGPPAPRRPSLSSPSLSPRHGSERRCFKCQTGHTCEGLSAQAEYKAWLSASPVRRAWSRAAAHCLRTAKLQGRREHVQKEGQLGRMCRNILTSTTFLGFSVDSN